VWIFSLRAELVEWGTFIVMMICVVAAVLSFVYVPIIGRYISAAIMVLCGALGAYDLGYVARGALDQSAAIQTRLDMVTEELASTQLVAESAAVRDKIRADNEAAMQSRIDTYEVQLSKTPADSRCALSADDVRSLSAVTHSRRGRPSSASGRVRP
jgi:hypothetical protein